MIFIRKLSSLITIVLHFGGFLIQTSIARTFESPKSGIIIFRDIRSCCVEDFMYSIVATGLEHAIHSTYIQTRHYG